MNNIEKLKKMLFSELYGLLLQKIQRKGRNKEELDEIICWLFGYTLVQLNKAIIDNTNLEDFISKAPKINDNAHLITGNICGYRVEEITDQFMLRLRQLDKLVDELAKGKKIEKIKRA